MDDIPTEYDQLTEDQKRRLFNSKLVRKGIAYQRIANGLEMLEEEDPAVYNQLVSGVLEKVGRVGSRKTVEDIIQAMITEVNEHTQLMEQEDDSYEETG